jgi:SAM-dependent methyltransferase
VPVDYDHRANRHSIDSPRVVIPILFEARRPRSLLDVGCGTGTWLSAARDFGVADVFGVDGVDIAAGDLLVPLGVFRMLDLNGPWSLNRRFDMAFCLEVAEHLDSKVAPSLIQALTSHADEIVFSAACPGQQGQHHVNCQWPVYWQTLFNAHGFVCSDALRWRIWNNPGVDVWYRQNMFIARRDKAGAGREERLKSVIHPDFLPHLAFASAASVISQRMADVANGSMPMGWYGSSALRALVAKIRRRFIPAS